EEPVARPEEDSEEGSEAPAETVAPTIMIEEQVLLDQDGIKITARSTTEPTEGTPLVTLEYENQTDHTLGFVGRDMTLNGYTFEDGSSMQPVEAGSTVQDIVYYYTSPTFEYLGITPETIGEIGITFRVNDQETLEDVIEIPAQIKTAAYDSMEVKKLEDGTELYDKDGLHITGKYVEADSLFGTGILLFVENGMDQKVDLWPYYAEFNGIEVKFDMQGIDCYAGGMTLGCVPIDPAVLAENGIEKVEMVRIGVGVEAGAGNTVADLQRVYLLEPAANPGHISDASAFDSFDTCAYPTFNEETYEFVENEVTLGQTLLRDAYTGAAAKTSQDADETHEAKEDPDMLDPGATGLFVADVFSTPIPDALVFYVYNASDAPAAFEDCVVMGIYNKNLNFGNGITAEALAEQPVEELIDPILGEPYDVREEVVNEMITDTIYRWKDENDQHALNIRIRVTTLKDDEEERQFVEVSSIEYINKTVAAK
ncbi:MAG: hypothetical protein K6A77_08810, partial [Clostridiales bacterium]|nr:hypothetical protein [Clostridiales bacterium]